MQKVLGFDIGIASIGWAFVEKDEKGKGRIVKSGVRIIPSSRDEQKVFNEFAEGKPASFAGERRQKKGTRRNIFRRKLRRERLRKLLLASGITFANTNRENSNPHWIWELRALATSEQIRLEEIGNVLMHLNNRRGFKSNRKTVSAEEGDTSWLKNVQSNSDALQHGKFTVGKLHYNSLKNDQFYSTRNKIFKRADYEAEFNQIWDTQSKFYPNILTDELKLRIGDHTIFYQRPLKSVKKQLSHCRYEKHHRVTSRSSPLFQFFRGFEKVLNLRIEDQLGFRRELTNVELEKLLSMLSDPKAVDAKGNITESKIRKVFGIGKEYDVNYEKIEANRTLLAIIKALDENGVDAEPHIKFDPYFSGNDDYDKQPLYKLWHALYSIEDETDLRKTLCEKFGFDLNTARSLMSIRLEPDYGSLSSRAMRKIVKEFKKFPENAAYGVIAAGYKHSDSETIEFREQRELLDSLEQIKKGTLRNPVVEKVLNQLISLTNAILVHPELGHPDEIRVELARELKSNAKQRKRMLDGMRKATDENAEISELLKNEFDIKKPTRRDIIRYTCWIEQGQQCLYSGETIARSQLFAGELLELDHIIPRARMYNDSKANLVLVKSAENKAKSDQTAYDFMQTKGDIVFRQYLSRVTTLYEAGKSRQKGISKGIRSGKRDFLMMTAKEIPTDFIDRQLKETQYIVKAAIGVLRGICRNVTSTTGSITDLLRHHWGVDNIFHQIQVAKYREWGKTYIETEDERTKGHEKINNWSKRLDHRHHAMDAIVVACTTQGFIQRLNNLNQLYDQDYEGLKTTLKKFNEPWSGFHQDFRIAIESIVVSFRNRRRVASWSRNLIKARGKVIKQITLTPRGPLHQDTVYGRRLINNGTRIKLDKKMGLEQAKLIVDPAIRKLVLKRLSEASNDPQKAFRELKKTPLVWKEKELTDVLVYDEIFTTTAKIDEKFNHFDAIVAKDVREALQNHLKLHNNDRKQAFGDPYTKPAYYNESIKLPIRKVRIKARAEELTAARAFEGKPNDYVIEKNNHHMAIYISPDGEYQEKVVTFWEAFERKKSGDNVIRKTNEAGYKLVMTLMINDLVLVDWEKDELPQTSFEAKDYLFRVQTISSGDVRLRHQYESGLENNEALRRITSLDQLASRLIKVRSTILGDLIYETNHRHSKSM